jgi:hypothetical protein
VLVTANWCPFTVPATGFWREAAHAEGLPLEVVDAESDQGGRLIATLGIAGIPCVAAGPGRLHYGYQLVSAGARAFLAGASPASPPAEP